MSKYSHIVAKSFTHFVCLHCGSELEIKLPVGLTELANVAKDFGKRHKKCKAKNERD